MEETLSERVWRCWCVEVSKDVAVEMAQSGRSVVRIRLEE